MLHTPSPINRYCCDPCPLQGVARQNQNAQLRFCFVLFNELLSAVNSAVLPKMSQFNHYFLNTYSFQFENRCVSTWKKQIVGLGERQQAKK